MPVEDNNSENFAKSLELLRQVRDGKPPLVAVREENVFTHQRIVTADASQAHAIAAALQDVGIPPEAFRITDKGVEIPRATLPAFEEALSSSTDPDATQKGVQEKVRSALGPPYNALAPDRNRSSLLTSEQLALVQRHQDQMQIATAEARPVDVTIALTAKQETQAAAREKLRVARESGMLLHSAEDNKLVLITTDTDARFFQLPMVKHVEAKVSPVTVNNPQTVRVVIDAKMLDAAGMLPMGLNPKELPQADASSIANAVKELPKQQIRQLIVDEKNSEHRGRDDKGKSITRHTFPAETDAEAKALIATLEKAGFRAGQFETKSGKPSVYISSNSTKDFEAFVKQTQAAQHVQDQGIRSVIDFVANNSPEAVAAREKEVAVREAQRLEEVAAQRKQRLRELESGAPEAYPSERPTLSVQETLKRTQLEPTPDGDGVRIVLSEDPKRAELQRSETLRHLRENFGITGYPTHDPTGGTKAYLTFRGEDADKLIALVPEDVEKPALSGQRTQSPKAPPPVDPPAQPPRPGPGAGSPPDAMPLRGAALAADTPLFFDDTRPLFPTDPDPARLVPPGDPLQGPVQASHNPNTQQPPSPAARPPVQVPAAGGITDPTAAVLLHRGDIPENLGRDLQAAAQTAEQRGAAPLILPDAVDETGVVRLSSEQYETLTTPRQPPPAAGVPSPPAGSGNQPSGGTPPQQTERHAHSGPGQNYDGSRPEPPLPHIDDVDRPGHFGPPEIRPQQNNRQNSAAVSTATSGGNATAAGVTGSLDIAEAGRPVGGGSPTADTAPRSVPDGGTPAPWRGADLDVHVGRLPPVVSLAMNLNQAWQGVGDTSDPQASALKKWTGATRTVVAVGDAAADVAGWLNPALKLTSFTAKSSVIGAALDAKETFDAAVAFSEGKATWEKEGHQLAKSGASTAVSSTGAVGALMARYGATQATVQLGGRLALGASTAGIGLLIEQGVELTIEGYAEHSTGNLIANEHRHVQTKLKEGIHGTTHYYTDLPTKPQDFEYTQTSKWLKKMKEERPTFSDGTPIDFERLRNNPNEFRRVVADTMMADGNYAQRIYENTFSSPTSITAENASSFWLTKYTSMPLANLARKARGKDDVETSIAKARESMDRATANATIGQGALTEISGDLGNGRLNYQQRHDQYVKYIQPIENEYFEQVEKLNQLRDTVGSARALADSRKLDDLRLLPEQQEALRPLLEQHKKASSKSSILVDVAVANARGGYKPGVDLDEIVGAIGLKGEAAQAEKERLKGLVGDGMKMQAYVKQRLRAEMEPQYLQALAQANFQKEMEKVEGMTPEDRANYFQKNKEFVEKAQLKGRRDLVLVGLSTDEDNYLAKRMEFKPQEYEVGARKEKDAYDQSVTDLKRGNEALARNILDLQTLGGPLTDKPVLDRNGNPVRDAQGRDVTLADEQRNKREVLDRENKELKILREKAESGNLDLKAKVAIKEAGVAYLEREFATKEKENLEYQQDQLRAAKGEYAQQTQQMLENVNNVPGGTSRLDEETRQRLDVVAQQVEAKNDALQQLRLDKEAGKPVSQAELDKAEAGFLMAHRRLAMGTAEAVHSQVAQQADKTMQEDMSAMQQLLARQQARLNISTPPVEPGADHQAAHAAHERAVEAYAKQPNPQTLREKMETQAHLDMHHNKPYLEAQFDDVKRQNDRFADVTSQVRGNVGFLEEGDQRTKRSKVEESPDTVAAREKMEQARAALEGRRPGDNAPLSERMAYENSRMEMLAAERTYAQARNQEMEASRGRHQLPQLAQGFEPDMTFKSDKPIPQLGEQPLNGYSFRDVKKLDEEVQRKQNALVVRDMQHGYEPLTPDEQKKLKEAAERYAKAIEAANTHSSPENRSLALKEGTHYVIAQHEVLEARSERQEQRIARADSVPEQGAGRTGTTPGEPSASPPGLQTNAGDVARTGAETPARVAQETRDGASGEAKVAAPGPQPQTARPEGNSLAQAAEPRDSNVPRNDAPAQGTPSNGTVAAQTEMPKEPKPQTVAQGNTQDMRKPNEEGTSAQTTKPIIEAMAEAINDPKVVVVLEQFKDLMKPLYRGDVAQAPTGPNGSAVVAQNLENQRRLC